MEKRLQDACLYGIVDLAYVEESRCEGLTEALLAGGVDLLQLRAKNCEASRICEIARRLAPLCRGAQVPFIVNDHVEIALEVGADGVHLGQDDGCLREAAARLPTGAIVGRSTHSLAQARAALQDVATYIGFGPLFLTPTKEGRPAIGLEEISRVEEQVGIEIPVFCIGGIKLANLSEVLASGARRVVIVSGLLQAADVSASCAEVRAILRG